MKSEPIPKRFRHYKGGIYEFVCEAKLESEPSVIMVAYRSQDGSAWTRPRDIFFEDVELDGVSVPRFSAIN